MIRQGDRAQTNYRRSEMLPPPVTKTSRGVENMGKRIGMRALSILLAVMLVSVVVPAVSAWTENDPICCLLYTSDAADE